MRYYPVFLDLRDRLVLVVGGGKVAEHKVQTLLRCGAKIALVSPSITSKLKTMARNGAIRQMKRVYRMQDLQGAYMVFATTNDHDVQKTVARDARRKHIPVNIADRAALCDFITPSIFTRGDLTIAVSTGGASPALAQRLRRDISRQFGHAYADLLGWLGSNRREILRVIPSQSKRRRLFRRLFNSGLIELLKRGQRTEARRMLSDILTRWGVSPHGKVALPTPKHRRKTK